MSPNFDFIFLDGGDALRSRSRSQIVPAPAPVSPTAHYLHFPTIHPQQSFEHMSTADGAILSQAVSYLAQEQQRWYADENYVLIPYGPYTYSSDSPNTSISSSSSSSAESIVSPGPFSSPQLSSPPSPPSFTTQVYTELDKKRAKIMARAGPIEQVRQAILTLLYSAPWENQQDIEAHQLMPLIEPLPYDQYGRQGSRGGIRGYRCKFGTCNATIKRRDHMLDHVRHHLEMKPFACPCFCEDATRCVTRFLRMADLKRHVQQMHKQDLDEECRPFQLIPKPKAKRGPRKKKIDTNSAPLFYQDVCRELLQKVWNSWFANQAHGVAVRQTPCARFGHWYLPCYWPL